MPRHKQGMECLCSSTTFRAWRYVEHVASMALGWSARLCSRCPSAAHRNAPLRGGGGEVETRAAALRRPGLRGNGVSTCRCASGSERRRSRTRRGAGVVEALEPSTGVSGARQPCGPAGRPTAKDGGETGKSVCGPRPSTPVDAEVDLDVIWMPGGLLVTDRLERGFL